MGNRREYVRDVAPEETKKNDSPARPVHKVKVGAISASIWENESKFGKRYSVTVEQLYQDDEDKWKSTSSINSSQLPQAEKALSRAYDWIANSEEEGRA